MTASRIRFFTRNLKVVQFETINMIIKILLMNTKVYIRIHVATLHEDL